MTQKLNQHPQKKLRIKTVFTAAPDVVEKFKQDKEQYGRFVKTGAHISSICPLMDMNNPLFSKKPVITNSNKLRTYSTARYYDDEDILNKIIRVK